MTEKVYLPMENSELLLAANALLVGILGVGISEYSAFFSKTCTVILRSCKTK